MGRPQNPNRRAELLEQLIALTARMPLSHLTFRSIAKELEVSTYTLSYHFGSRRDIIDAVLSEAMRSRLEVIGGMSFQGFSREEMASGLRTAFRATLSDEHLGSLRLQFEGAALEGLDPDVGPHVSETYDAWVHEFCLWVQSQGVSHERATLLARIMSDTVTGMQFAQVLRGNREQTVAEFDLFVEGYMKLISTENARRSTEP